MSAFTPQQAASCVVNVFECHGKNAKWAAHRCCPEAEPGGFHVGLGAMLLPGTFSTREEAVTFAKTVVRWVGVAIDYDRRDLFGKHTKAPDPELEPDVIKLTCPCGEAATQFIIDGADSKVVCAKYPMCTLKEKS